MRKLSLIFLLLLLISLPVLTQGQSIALRIGAEPIFANFSTNCQIKGFDVSLNDKLGIGKSETLWEGRIGIYNPRFSVRGYWIFPKNQQAEAVLPTYIAVDNDKKPIPVNTICSFSATRIEFGAPFLLHRMLMLEPFFAYQNVCPSVSIDGRKFHYIYDVKCSGSGLGITIFERLSQDLILTGKIIGFNNASQFDVACFWVNGNLFLGGGYTWRKWDFERVNLRLSGPTLNVGLVF